MGNKRLGSVILASALFAWGCGPASTGTGTPAQPAPRALQGLAVRPATPARPAPPAPAVDAGTAGTTGSGRHDGHRRHDAAPRGTTGIRRHDRRRAARPVARPARPAPREAPRVAAARPAPREAPRARAAGAAPPARPARPARRDGGTPSGVAVKLDATRQTIQGFGINTALMPSGKTFPVDKLFTTTATDSIGLSILRIGMNSDGSLTGQFISQAKAKFGAEGHRVDLEPARELQEQREHAAGWVPARELLRLVVDDDRQLRAGAGAVRHVDRERVRLRLVRSRRTTVHRRLRHDDVHRQDRWWPGSRWRDRRSRPRGSRSSRPKHRNGSTPGATSRPRARSLPAIRRARIR